MSRKIMTALVSAALLAALFAGPAAGDIVTGLVAYYPYDGNADDYSGKGNNPLFANAGYTQDRFGQANHATSYNGSSQYIQYAHQSWLDVNGATGFTVAAWYLASASWSGDHFDLIDKSHGASDNLGWTVQGDPANIAFAVGAGGGLPWTNFRAAHFAWPKDNQWHHLAGVLAPTGNLSEYNLSIYLDGVLKDSQTYTFTISNNTRPLYIGKHHSLGRYYLGDLDEARIYQRALSQSDILELMAVPLPAGWLIFASGLAALGLRRRQGKS